MKNQVKPAVIGGTGKSGKYLVKELINRGIHFKLLIRNPEHFQLENPLVEVVYGNVLDEKVVDELLSGCSAVISTLGLGIPPSEPDLFEKATAHVLRAMEKNSIQRYIVTTGLNVDAPSDRKKPKAAAATQWMKENYPISTASKQIEHEMLASSKAKWTMVRLPMIMETDQRSEIAVDLHDCPGEGISAANLAAFLVDQLSDETFVKQAPFIADK